ncbi:MAG TPA: sialidase family protein [Gemmataceae bacterium]|nr:sialidase family protein [Gemmataceae bacterium]
MLHILSAVLLLSATPKAEVVEVKKIWDRGQHNAFTDLARFNDQWFCVFREGKAHVSPDGAIRVLTSTDGKEWSSAALITSKTMDLRDPKIMVTPEKELMIVAAGALHDKSKHSHQSLVWISKDGKDWGEPTPVADPDFWLWRVSWHGDAALGIGYPTGKGDTGGIRVYRSTDGKAWETVAKSAFDKDYPNETGIVINADGTATALLRRDKGTLTAQLGTAKPPYAEWTWRDLGVRVGGPAMIRVPDIGLIAVVRLHDKKVRTGVCAVDEKAGTLTELVTLPSGGDTSYAGLVWHDGLLWVSYYASHEGKTSVYLAKVRLTGVK